MENRNEFAAVGSIGDWGALRNQVQGAVFVPDQEGYDDARLAWNRYVDQHPAVIVAAKEAEDVRAAVAFAKQAGYTVAVQSTGHGVIRPADGCLLILTGAIQDVAVDAETATAWVGAGAKWAQVLEQAQACGLAPLLGSSPGVGAVGYTLGGGMGWLARKYGLSLDSVLRFQVVTADAVLVNASQEENPDLYWALRGGGGAFGVITAMQIRLYPVTNVYGGNLFYPAEDARAVLTRYRDWVKQAPDELTSSVVLVSYPPFPQIPEFLRGKSFVIVRGCFSGDVEQGQVLIDSWRAWKAPLIDVFGVMPFSQVAKISSDPVDPVASLSTGAWLNEISDDVINAMIRFSYPVGGPSPLMFTEVRNAGGAISRVAPEANAYGNRDARFIFQSVGPIPSPEAAERFHRYTNEYKLALQAAMTGGVYPNFLEGQEAWARTRDAFLPRTHRRLREIKTAYDPGNLFCHSLDITPLGEGE